MQTHLTSCSFEFQLKLCKGISYAAVAAHADKNGRRRLAAMLVEHEPRSSKQVCNFTFIWITLNGKHSWGNVFIFLVFSLLHFISYAMFWTSSLPPQEKLYLSIFWNFIIYSLWFLPSGPSSFKHRRGRYSFDEGNWKWWYGPCLSCFVSYLAKGNTSTNSNKIF